MRKIKVLVVDDSVVIRKIVTDALTQDPSIEVAGVAANGKIALQKIPVLKPDILTLDVEMPEMNGLETLEHLRKDHPNLPVVMFSSLTQQGASATLDALARGASDYVTKPTNVHNVLGAVDHIRTELVPRIKALCSSVLQETVEPLKTVEPETETPVETQPEPAPPTCTRIDCLAIGVSTGGPNALGELMPCLPEDLPVPVLIVQHMPPHFTKLLADRLNSKSKLEILENQPGLEVKPGRAIVAAGDYHMTIHRQKTRVVTGANQNPPENSCRPAVDVLFRSVADLYGANVLAVILTGMGQDGLKGCRKIRANGGRVIVQDEATSVVWGMPGFVAREGLAEKVLPLSEIPSKIVEICQSGDAVTPAR